MSGGTETTRLEAFAELGTAEREMLSGMAGPPANLPRGTILREEGSPEPQLFLLIDGWVAATVRSPAGTRQLLKIHMPGDLLGLPSLAFLEAVDTLEALTPATVLPFPDEALGRLFVLAPRLAAILFLISQEERGLLIDRVASMGRAGAVQRIAALVLQLHARVLRHDPGAGTSFHVPIRQAELADLAGITTVHVNRVLQELRSLRLVEWSRQTIHILDLTGLRALAGIPLRHVRRHADWLPPPHAG